MVNKSRTYLSSYEQNFKFNKSKEELLEKKNKIKLILVKTFLLTGSNSFPPPNNPRNLDKTLLSY